MKHPHTVRTTVTKSTVRVLWLRSFLGIECHTWLERPPRNYVEILPSSIRSCAPLLKTGDEEELHRCRPLVERGGAPNSPIVRPTRVRAEVCRPRERRRRQRRGGLLRSNRSGNSTALALSQNSRRSLGRVLRKVAKVGMRVRAAVPGPVGWAASLEPIATKIEHALPAD